MFSLFFMNLQEIDVRAGGGKPITIGELCRHFLERLEWFDTRFPRIPVKVQVCKLKNYAKLIDHCFDASVYPCRKRCRGISRKCSRPDPRSRASSWTGSRPRARKGRRRRPRPVGRRTPWRPAPPAIGRGQDLRAVTDDDRVPAAATEATNGMVT